MTTSTTSRVIYGSSAYTVSMSAYASIEFVGTVWWVGGTLLQHVPIALRNNTRRQPTFM